jgi:SNF2 family DNA or RNA helicase
MLRNANIISLLIPFHLVPPMQCLDMGDLDEPRIPSVCGRYKLAIPTKLKLLKREILRIVAEHKTDKVIVFSTFKGALDVAEGLLAQLEISCRRFDGDDTIKDAELEAFQAESAEESRVLLATIQSGGVGLNITQANHVFFMDRWYVSVTVSVLR